MEQECMSANKAFANTCHAIGYITILDKMFFFRNTLEG